MGVASRALAHMSLGGLEEGKGPRSLGRQPGRGRRRRAAAGGRGVAHHQPAHPHVGAVGRQAEGQEAQQGPQVHVSGARQLSRAPGQQVGVPAASQPFAQHFPLGGGRGGGRGVGCVEVRRGGALQVQQEAVHFSAWI